jgi:nitronate monooxygenase/enoyl-[acyl-carrier protein] reductase II
VLRTDICDLLGVDLPIIQAPYGAWTSAEVVAAVSNAGALGSIAAAGRPIEDLRSQLKRIRELTDRPFAANHVMRLFADEAYAATLEARPRVISVALGDPGDLVERAHEAGSLFVQQVHTVQQARQAAERGVDVIIAQGSEAGGFGGTVSTLALVPQVVDAVSPIPVVAAGGIADGRGLAAALILGAQGANIGTRFMASAEAAIPDGWKQDIVAAQSEDAVKVAFWNDVMPPEGGGYDTLPRALRTPFIERWNPQREEASREAARLREEIGNAMQQGGAHELVPFTGQTAGLIRDILPAAEIVRQLVAEAEQALQRGAGVLA